MVTIVGFDDSWAIKSQGTSQTRTMLDSICGIDFCNVSQKTDEKISNYLGEIAGSNVNLFDYANLDKNIAYITKTSNISKDFQLVHFSDGRWQLINRGVVEGLKESQNELGESQMEFGGAIDLSSGQQNIAKKTIGKLSVSESIIVRPLSDNVKDIQIFGNVGKKALPNILLTINYPDDRTQDFIISVSDSGDFDAGLNIDKNTSIGTYHVSAKYASSLLGSVTFDVTAQKTSMLKTQSDDQKINSINLSSNKITIPSSIALSYVIQVSGTVADYHKGIMVELVLVSQNGKEFTRKVPTSKDGVFSTFFNITPEFPEGSHMLVMNYLDQEVAKTPIIAMPSSLMLR